MVLQHLYDLGKLVIMELNFPTLPDDEIVIGQWIVLWNEIPIRKIGSNIYEVYPDAHPYEFETLEEKIAKMAEGFSFINITDSRDFYSTDYIISKGRNLIKEGTKYLRTKGGSIKRHPWESPRFFG